jgi:dihydroxyacetone kinase
LALQFNLQGAIEFIITLTKTIYYVADKNYLAGVSAKGGGAGHSSTLYIGNGSI